MDLSTIGVLELFALVLVALGSALAPWAGAAFVIIGAVPFYSLIDMVGMRASGTLTGLVFGMAGISAIGRLYLSSRPSALQGLSGRGRRWVGLFLMFAIIWYARWISAPAGTRYYVGNDPFAERALVFAAVFALFPFLIGVATRSGLELRKLIRWIAIFGAAQLVFVGYFWAKGVDSNAITGTWEPVPTLSALALSFNVGIGAIALHAVLDQTRFRILAALRWVLLMVATAIIVRVGQRGPFLFFLVAVGGLILHRPGSSVGRRLILLALTGILLLAVIDSASREASRVVTLENYGAEKNEARLAIFEAVVAAFAEHPLIGSGGSLVGMPIVDSTFQYAHVILVDPLLETGILGAVPFYLLFFGVFAALVRHRGVFLDASPEAPALVAMLVYSFCEGMVSGHFAISRHFWLFFGCAARLLGSLVRARASQGPARTARLGEPHTLTSQSTRVG